MCVLPSDLSLICGSSAKSWLLLTLGFFPGCAAAPWTLKVSYLRRHLCFLKGPLQHHRFRSGQFCLRASGPLPLSRAFLFQYAKTCMPGCQLCRVRLNGPLSRLKDNITRDMNSSVMVDAVPAQAHGSSWKIFALSLLTLILDAQLSTGRWHMRIRTLFVSLFCKRSLVMVVSHRGASAISNPIWTGEILKRPCVDFTLLEYSQIELKAL